MTQGKVRTPPSLGGERIIPDNPFERFQLSETVQSIAARFEKQVARRPGKTALESEGRHFTYRELNDAAKRAAAAIAEQCPPGARAALLLEHDACVVVGILAALKAGATYVPLEPAYPQARMEYMLADSGARVILTNARNLDRARSMASDAIAVINIDCLDARSDCTGPQGAAGPDDIAYILYTSGSTGSPKGVTQSHRNVLHNVMRYTNNLHISADDRMSLLQSCSFSGSVSVLFCALLDGGTLSMYNLYERGFSGLGDWFAGNGITAYCSVPAVFRSFAQALPEGFALPDLRLIRIEGDQVTRSDADLFRAHFPPPCILANGLGSTECGLYRQFLITAETEIDAPSVPVGYEVEGTEVLLLDDRRRGVPPGAEGEIVVRGRHLSPGYHGKGELTEAAFVEDSEEGVRLYFTGDLGVMRDDGCLVHLGRKDFQVKVRGYRVEAGEVEAAIEAMPNVRQAVVTARDDLSSGGRLVAYLVPDGPESPTVTELRRGLTRVLPDYMIPSHFVFLDAMPLSANQKVDRRALGAPGRQRPPLAEPFEAPRTPLEEELGHIWADVLEIDRVGINDNFLELGGHSLLAAQVISRVFERFKIDVPATRMLATRTVAEMAPLVSAQLAEGEPDEVVRLLDMLGGPEV